MMERPQQKVDTDVQRSDSESFASDEKNYLLPKQMRGAFRPSPYGLHRRQDATSFGWQVERSFVVASWKWLLLHPVLARATAYAAPSILPLFYAGYSVTFVASLLGVEVAMIFLAQHALFFIIARFRSPALCYATGLLLLLLKFSAPRDFMQQLYFRYGAVGYMVTMACFQWNLLRGLSFSLETGRQTPKQSEAGPPYWRTLAYCFYLPPLYLGPMQNYCDFETQVDKVRTHFKPQEVMAIVGRLARSGVHFVPCGGLHPLLLQFGDVEASVDRRGTGHSDFAGALASAEGIVLPPHSKCITRLTRCTHFWRYFDRGMHLWIRRYVYDPLVGDRRGAAWMLFVYWASPPEVLVAEARKLRPVKDFEERYLTTPGRLRVAGAVLGSPNYLLTICACIFHLADYDICVILCKRILLGFPFPLVPVLVVLYTACYVQPDIVKWETSTRLVRKEHAS
ncbi:hypothetical protein MTO96_007124 [Rhipicephalus appendiculatus]